MKDIDKSLAIELITTYKEHLTYGKMIIGIWKNKEDLQAWVNPINRTSISMRLSVVNSSEIPEIEVANKSEVIIGALAISEKEDYSDTVIVYYISAAYRT